MMVPLAETITQVEEEQEEEALAREEVPSRRDEALISEEASIPKEEVGGELVGDGNDTTSREGFVTECQALDDEIVETGGGGEVSVEEDVIEEGLEEAVYHGRGEDGVAKEKGDGGLIRRGEDVGVIARDGMEAGEDDEKLVGEGADEVGEGCKGIEGPACVVDEGAE
ncbi:uncharacterized protein A4U43_C10F14640 [Asparagus officinalis]|uniref:Uncharacterized protein n=1 Tax=Asparagus officinalis TaxID=4686 RepID=A0A5P1E300_ASPOF|nr:uncharacterized protein A4U43_C10F14640 [Asparagus officinalis]